MSVDKDARREFYVRTLRIRWGELTPRERRRLKKVDPLLYIALRRLLVDGLLRP